jgi:hypothetical protein
MPLAFDEKYSSGAEVQARTVEDGCDIMLPLTLRGGISKLIVAFVPIGSSFSYVYGLDADADGHFPDPEELTDLYDDPVNLRGLMIPGEKHTVLLHEQPGAPSALVIRHLGDQAMDRSPLL